MSKSKSPKEDDDRKGGVPSILLEQSLLTQEQSLLTLDAGQSLVDAFGNAPTVGEASIDNTGMSAAELER